MNLPNPAPTLTRLFTPTSARNVWWVNQGHHFLAEASRCVLRAPLGNLESHLNVSRVRPGDIVIHHVGGFIRAVSIVAHLPVEVKDPIGITTDRIRTVTVRYHFLDELIPLSSLPMAWRLAESLREPLTVRGDVLKLRAFNRHGAANQKYLVGLSDTFVRHLLEIPEFVDVFEQATDSPQSSREAA